MPGKDRDRDRRLPAPGVIFSGFRTGSGRLSVDKPRSVRIVRDFRGAPMGPVFVVVSGLCPLLAGCRFVKGIWVGGNFLPVVAISGSPHVEAN